MEYNKIIIIECIVAAVVSWFLSIVYYGYYMGRLEKNAGIKAIQFRKKEILILVGYILLGTMAGLAFTYYQYSVYKVLKYICLIFGFILIAQIDFKKRIIPNQLLLVLLGIRIAIMLGEILTYPSAAKEFIFHALGGLVGGFIIFLIGYFLSKKSLGMGDVKMVAVMGFYLGLSLMYVTVIISLLCAAGYGVVQLVRKKIGLKDAVSFAPFLAVGTCISLVLGF